MWNHIAADQPPEPKQSSSGGSSSSSSRSDERKDDKKRGKEDAKASKPTPWDNELSHPSAFLTTRFNRLLPWPFPLGKAGNDGPEVWWESGTPAHVSIETLLSSNRY